MAGTLTIPQTQLPVGQSVFPAPAAKQFALADTDTLAVLVIDRTPPGGFNSLTAATTCAITIQQSADGGATWSDVASAGFAGGIQTNHAGQVNSNNVGIVLQPGTGRLARAVVDVAGPSPVTVTGSLTVS